MQAPPTQPGGRDRGDRRPPLRFTPAVSWSLAAAIPIVIVVGAVVEPAANGPEPVLPAWINALAAVTFFAALGAVFALIAVQRFGVWLAAVTGAGLFALTLLCPVSGHHVVGSYTYVQFALSGGLLAASALILRLCGPTTGPKGLA